MAEDIGPDAVPLSIMNLMLVAAERGYKDCEAGKNLQAAFMSIHDMFEVEKPASNYSPNAGKRSAC